MQVGDVIAWERPKEKREDAKAYSERKGRRAWTTNLLLPCKKGEGERKGK